MPYIEDLPLDLIVFGGTRIIRGEILDHPKDGVVNSHPGLLPDCRGSASPAWVFYHDIPIGSSTHFCDNGIDTGDLLLRREVPVKRGMTYEDLCYETLVLAGVLMKEALMGYEEGRWDEMRHPQEKVNILLSRKTLQRMCCRLFMRNLQSKNMRTMLNRS